MATLDVGGFEAGDSSETNTTSGTFSIQTSTVRTGTYALRVNPTTTGAGYFAITGCNSSTGAVSTLSAAAPWFIRFYFRYATKAASNYETFCEILASGKGSQRMEICLNSTGTISVYAGSTGTTLLATGLTVLSANTWYRIEIKRDPTSGSHAWEVKIDGTSEVTGTTDFKSASPAQVRLGKAINYNGNSVDYFYDDYLIATGAYPGAGGGLLLTPNANGNYQTWSIGAGSGSNFQVVDDIPHNIDTDYLLSTGTSSNAETEALTDTATAGISGTINSAKAFAILKRDGASNGSVKLRTRSGSTDSDLASAFTPGASYATCARILDTDPATSSAWTTSGLDGVEVGAVEQSVNKTRMTMCGLYVDFVASAAPAATGIPFRRRSTRFFRQMS